MRRKVDWNAIAAMIAAFGLVFTAMGAFYTGSQVRTARQIAKLQFLREYYSRCQDFNALQRRLTPGGDWYEGRSGPQTNDEWFDVERYMGLLEQLAVWYSDGVLDRDVLDRSYGHRIKALYGNPYIRKKCLEDQAFRWQSFLELHSILADAPIYSRLPGPFEAVVAPTSE